MSNWLENLGHALAQPAIMNVLLQSYVQGAVRVMKALQNKMPM